MGFKSDVSSDQRTAETQIDEEMLALVTQLTNEINWCLRERGLSRIARFGTRFTIETEIFGALGSFEVVAPKHDEVDEVHRIYLELATDGCTSPANVENLRRIARAIRARERVDAIVLAGTDLNVIFDEATAGFPAVDCAAAHIDAILDRVGESG